MICVWILYQFWVSFEIQNLIKRTLKQCLLAICLKPMMGYEAEIVFRSFELWDEQPTTPPPRRWEIISSPKGLGTLVRGVSAEDLARLRSWGLASFVGDCLMKLDAAIRKTEKVLPNSGRFSFSRGRRIGARRRNKHVKVIVKLSAGKNGWKKITGLAKVQRPPKYQDYCNGAPRYFRIEHPPMYELRVVLMLSFALESIRRLSLTMACQCSGWPVGQGDAKRLQHHLKKMLKEKKIKKLVGTI